MLRASAGKTATNSGRAARTTSLFVRVSATTSTRRPAPPSRRLAATRRSNAWTGFGLDRDGLAIPDENAIPRTEVAGATDRNLGTPPPAGSDPRPETRQQPEMGDVPNRGTGGIGTRAEIETDHREHGGHAFDGNAGCTTPLDATD
jgi:hypothetical protein